MEINVLPRNSFLSLTAMGGASAEPCSEFDRLRATGIHNAVNSGKDVIGIMVRGGTQSYSGGHDVDIYSSTANANGSYTFTYYNPETNITESSNSIEFYNDAIIIIGIK